MSQHASRSISQYISQHEEQYHVTLNAMGYLLEEIRQQNSLLGREWTRHKLQELSERAERLRRLLEE